jgi:hypothetical protein
MLVTLTACSAISNYVTREQNPKCQNVDEVKIFQTLDNGALAYVCERKSYTDCAMGITVFVPKRKDMLFYDEQRISPSDGKCFVFDDVYKYTSKDERDRTVPKVKVEDRFLDKIDQEKDEK